MDVGSVSSVPSSVSSNTSARSTPVPNTYKPLTQSQSVLALTKISDDDMRRRSPDELVHIIRRLETENRTIIGEHSAITKDVNKRMQILLLEVRGLKDINQSLQDDNQELRDLCCFLDDDRQRGRKLAREWQRFGRYTASVMRSEVSAYQEKLKELETKQQELISDNMDLKELCLFLDQDRQRIGQIRDEGDGSSNSTLAGNEEQASDPDRIELVPVSQLQNSGDNASGTNDYIRQLEEKIKHLEEGNPPQSVDNRPVSSYGLKDNDHIQISGHQRVGPDGNQSQDTGVKGTSPSKPEAVVHAMKVLEVHENLERPQTAVGEENLDDKEKAIVREMCNVVWRKLGNVSSEHDSETSTPHPVYENIEPSRGQTRHPDPETHVQFTTDPSRHTHHTDPYSTHPDHPGSHSQEAPYKSDIQPPVQRPDSHHKKHNSQPQYPRPDGKPAYQQGQQYPTSNTCSNPPPTPQIQRSHPNNQPSHPSNQPPHPSNQPSHPSNQPAPPNPHYGNQPPKYGYVRTSRSTPVTPIPQQRSHSPGPKIPLEVRSHSPGPNRKDLQQNLQYGNQQKPPNLRSDSQSSYVSQNQPSYQNQTPLNKGNNSSQHAVNYQNQAPLARGDNSYENIPQGYSYTQPSTHDRSRDSGYDLPPPPPPHSKSQYMYTDSPSPSPGYTQGQVPRGIPQSGSSFQGHVQYQGSGSQNAQNPPYYQNVQGQKPPSASRQRRDKSPHNTQYNPLPQSTPQRNTPTNHSSHTSYPQPHPSQQAPPQGRDDSYQYTDRRSAAYTDARDISEQQYDQRNRRDIEQYYRK